jgi:hypothetical protein
MAEIRREPQHHSGVKLGDILFALFKRKRTIVGCAALGIIAAAAVYFLYPPSSDLRLSCWCSMFWKAALSPWKQREPARRSTSG